MTLDDSIKKDFLKSLDKIHRNEHIKQFAKMAGENGFLIYTNGNNTLCYTSDGFCLQTYDDEPIRYQSDFKARDDTGDFNDPLTTFPGIKIEDIYSKIEEEISKIVHKPSKKSKNNLLEVVDEYVQEIDTFYSVMGELNDDDSLREVAKNIKDGFLVYKENGEELRYTKNGFEHDGDPYEFYGGRLTKQYFDTELLTTFPNISLREVKGNLTPYLKKKDKELYKRIQEINHNF